MTVRLIGPGEGAAAAELDRSCEGAAHWDAGAYERIAEEAGSGRLCLIAGDERGDIAGLLLLAIAADEAELLNIAVAPAAQRRGVGTQLLQAAVERARAAGAASMWLEVRESNRPALEFYRRCGFQITGRRRAYYDAPAEDALLLRRDFS